MTLVESTRAFIEDQRQTPLRLVQVKLVEVQEFEGELGILRARDSGGERRLRERTNWSVTAVPSLQIWTVSCLGNSALDILEILRSGRVVGNVL